MHRTNAKKTVQEELETAGRTLHLLDVENLCGSALPVEEHVRSTLDCYRIQMCNEVGGHVVLAASGHTAFLAGASWPGTKVLAGHGRDGADKALLEFADVRHIATRYDRVVVGSGDHIFAPLVSELMAAGVMVTVVAPSKSIAWALRLARPEIRHFVSPSSSDVRGPSGRMKRRLGQPYRNDAIEEEVVFCTPESESDQSDLEATGTHGWEAWHSLGKASLHRSVRTGSASMSQRRSMMATMAGTCEVGK